MFGLLMTHHNKYFNVVCNEFIWPWKAFLALAPHVWLIACFLPAFSGVDITITTRSVSWSHSKLLLFIVKLYWNAFDYCICIVCHELCHIYCVLFIGGINKSHSRWWDYFASPSGYQFLSHFLVAWYIIFRSSMWPLSRVFSFCMCL